MSPIKLTPIQLLGEDERGQTFEFFTKKTGAFMMIKRKAGSLSGNAYHEGKNAGTAPKTFIHLSGKMTLQYRGVDEQQVHTLTVETPSIIEVAPMTVHAVYAETDILVLEANSIADIREDRIRQSVQLDLACDESVN